MPEIPRQRGKQTQAGNKKKQTDSHNQKVAQINCISKITPKKSLK